MPVKKIVIAGVACPVERAMKVIGDRWSTLLLRDLFYQGPLRFQDFMNSLSGLSPNILSNRLKKLQKFGIIETREYSSRPMRHEYLLTEMGTDLAPIIADLCAWGNKHTTD